MFLSQVDGIYKVNDVRDVRDWAHIFKNDQFIEYLDSENNERVMNKPEYLRNIINYMKSNYFESLFETKKKKSVLLGKSKDSREIHPESIEELSLE